MGRSVGVFPAPSFLLGEGAVVIPAPLSLCPGEESCCCSSFLSPSVLGKGLQLFQSPLSPVPGAGAAVIPAPLCLGGLLVFQPPSFSLCPGERGGQYSGPFQTTGWEGKAADFPAPPLCLGEGAAVFSTHSPFCLGEGCCCYSSPLPLYLRGICFSSLLPPLLGEGGCWYSKPPPPLPGRVLLFQPPS